MISARYAHRAAVEGAPMNVVILEAAAAGGCLIEEYVLLEKHL